MGSQIPAQDEANRAPKTQLCTEAETSSDLQAKAVLDVSFRALKLTEESEISSLLLKSSFPRRADAETFFLLFFSFANIKLKNTLLSNARVALDNIHQLKRLIFKLLLH